MSSLDEIRIAFFQECDDLLEAMSEGLRQIELVGTDGETIHAVFRAVHSIKGGAGAFGLDELVTFAHRFETILDHVRSGKLDISPPVMQTLHHAGDHLCDLTSACRDGSAIDGEKTEKLLSALDDLIGGTPSAEDPASFGFVPMTIALEPLESDTSPAVDQQENSASFLIRFTALPELYQSGNEPALLLRALRKLGQVDVKLQVGDVPPLGNLESTPAFLSWSINLCGHTTEQEIRAIFDFVEDICQLEITLDGAQATLADEPAGNGHHADVALHATEAQPVTQVSVARPPTSQNTPAHDEGDRTLATIRVNLDRVDRLINLIGELVIKEAMLAQLVEHSDLSANSEVSKGLDGIKQLAGDIQEGVMAIRAQPLKPVFQRMHRIIREAAEATSKQVRLVSEGEHTEVDKTVIERLIDPLTHMIRNSVDHGLEDSETRLKKGKRAEGTVRLSAAHRSGRIIIEVADDGAGINRAKVQKAAEKKGLIPPGASLTTAEIDNLLFMPGFSSKDEVSALSGRGVGLDVVRREIQSLGGRVTIHSTEDVGTTFTIALPLTLAVLEGMIVGIEGQIMVIPITAILETLQSDAVKIHEAGPRNWVVQNRGELVPMIDVGEQLALRSSQTDFANKVLVIVETDAYGRAALIVDNIFDQRQVVIKSLEDNYGRINGISAATILGNGRIALILDPEEIVRPARSNSFAEYDQKLQPEVA